jgi:hypothetical protein
VGVHPAIVFQEGQQLGGLLSGTSVSVYMIYQAIYKYKYWKTITNSKIFRQNNFFWRFNIELLNFRITVTSELL